MAFMEAPENIEQKYAIVAGGVFMPSACDLVYIYIYVCVCVFVICLFLYTNVLLLHIYIYLFIYVFFRGFIEDRVGLAPGKSAALHGEMSWIPLMGSA